MMLIMFAFAAAQVATTNCTQTGVGAVSCTTTGTPATQAPAPQSFGTFKLDPNVIAAGRSRNIKKPGWKADCSGRLRRGGG